MSDLDDLRAELDEFAQPDKKDGRSPYEERIVSGFEEIQLFYQKHGRIPLHGENRDIFERLYAQRLDRLRSLEEFRNLLSPLDHQGLLEENAHSRSATHSDRVINDDELLDELEELRSPAGSITELRHVRTAAEKTSAEEIATREKCRDFEKFKPYFQQIENDLKNGLRHTKRFGVNGKIEKGNFFILNGQLAYIAEVGDYFRTANGEYNARLRVIYSNATESNILIRSLQSALYKDDAGRRVTEPEAGPLFSDSEDDTDIESGTIYVLRSKSAHPYIAEHRELIHKIGVTGGRVETRIAGAKHDPTYLLAEVEVVASYKLAGINRTKLENIIHRLFASAQLELTIHDRFGRPVQPREWFLLPLHIIDEAIRRIIDGSITNMIYDPKTARLISPA